MITMISNLTMLPRSWKIWAILVISAIGVIVVQRKKRAFSRSLSAFPEMKSLPIFGSLFLISGNMQVRVQKGLKMLKTLRSPVVFWFSYLPVVVLGKSEHILMVTSKNQDRYTLGIFENILQDGILLARGEQWRKIRRIMNPAFSAAMLQQYIIVFNQQARILVKRLRNRADTNVVTDLWRYISDMNFDTVTENMSDYKMQVQEKGGNEFSEAVMEALHMESMRATHPLLFFNLTYTIYRYMTGNKDLYEKVNKLPREIVRKKMKEHEYEKQHGNRISERPEKTLIDLLLKVHDVDPDFDEDRIRVEILNMIFAGSDTTATTVSLTLLFLAIHPQYQDKVYVEIQQVFEDDFIEVQMEHCVKLKYMEQCIKETLRRFSLVPLTARKCPEPVKLNDEQIIPANCMMAFAYHAVHQDPDIYPNPEVYNPERFSPDQCANNKNNFMGFGAGPRACIGSKYAMLSVKTQMVHVLKRYKLTSDIQISDVIHIVDIITRSQNGYPVKIWNRKSDHQND